MHTSHVATEQPAPVKFTVQRGSRRIQLTYQQLFAAAHKLWLGSKFEEASKVFEHLAVVSDRGPRAHILLAHCKAMLGDYAGCHRALFDALPIEQFNNAASDLHDIFVMWKCGFFHDVKQGLEKIVAEHPDLPTPCLMLGEFLMHAGNYQQPPHWLRQAIARDRPDGAVATIARSQLPIAMQRVSAQRTGVPAPAKQSAGRSAKS